MMHKILQLSVIVFLSLMTFGCATSITKTHIPATREVDTSKVIYVMQAKDGTYGDTIYSGSGLQVSKKVLRAVRRTQPLAQLVETTNEQEAIGLAKENGASYLLIPDLLHWEDRATAWSGYRDKVEIELRLLGLDPVEVIASKSYYTTNNSITLLSSKPEDLLDERFNSFVYQVLGK